MRAQTEVEALVDSGATHNLMDYRTAIKWRLGGRALATPKKIFNVDGTTNVAGAIATYCVLRILVGDKETRQKFYITNLGDDKLILGYPWLRHFNPQINWAKDSVTSGPVSLEPPFLKYQKLRLRKAQINYTEPPSDVAKVTPKYRAGGTFAGEELGMAQGVGAVQAQKIKAPLALAEEELYQSYSMSHAANQPLPFSEPEDSIFILDALLRPQLHLREGAWVSLLEEDASTPLTGPESPLPDSQASLTAYQQLPTGPGTPWFIPAPQDDPEDDADSSIPEYTSLAHSLFSTDPSTMPYTRLYTPTLSELGLGCEPGRTVDVDQSPITEPSGSGLEREPGEISPTNQSVIAGSSELEPGEIALAGSPCSVAATGRASTTPPSENPCTDVEYNTTLTGQHSDQCLRETRRSQDCLRTCRKRTGAAKWKCSDSEPPTPELSAMAKQSHPHHLWRHRTFFCGHCNKDNVTHTYKECPQWRRCLLCNQSGHYLGDCDAPHSHCTTTSCYVPIKHPHLGFACPISGIDKLQFQYPPSEDIEMATSDYIQFDNSDGEA